MTNDDLFRQQFHDSDAVGPADPKHWMYRTHASRFAVGALATYGLVALTLAVTIIVSELPTVIPGPNDGLIAGQEFTAEQTNQLAHRRAEWEVSLLKLVLCFGAVGGLLHLLTSLGRFVGSRTLERSWGLFYLLRPPIGAALGLLVYVILRMTVLSQGAETEIPAVNVYGVLAFSGLSGMFSRQAIEKLAEVFDVLFQKTKQGMANDEPLQRTSGRAASHAVDPQNADAQGTKSADADVGNRAGSTTSVATTSHEMSRDT